jgi:hypothetical protein
MDERMFFYCEQTQNTSSKKQITSPKENEKETYSI